MNIIKILQSSLLVIIILFNVQAFGQQLLKNKTAAHKSAILCVDISSDGAKIITGGADSRVNIWEAKTATKEKALSAGSAVSAVGFHSSNKLFLMMSGERVIVADGKTFQPRRFLKGHEGEITGAVFDPVNYNVATVSKDKKLLIFDANKGVLNHTCMDHTKGITAVAFSADGKNVATGGSDDRIVLWNVGNGMSDITIEAGSKGVNDLAFSSDGKYLASAGSNGRVVLWDARSGEELTVFTDLKSATALAFSPDVQYLAAGGVESKIIVWELNTKTVKNSINGHEKGNNDIVFSDKGDIMVTVGNDAAMKIWDVKKLKIGKKKFVSGEDAPELTCSPIMVTDNNNNGILEGEELTELKFTVSNTGKGAAYNVSAMLMLDNNIKGISFKKETVIGNIDAGAEQEVSIAVNVSKEVATASGTFIVSFSEAKGNVPSPIKANFQSRGAQQYNYIMVVQNSFSSATGKAEIGAPISLKLEIKNVSKGAAKNIKVNYLLPENVLAVDKLSEIVAEMNPGESKTMEMQFYATEKFKGTSIKMMLDIQNAAFSNAKDMVLSVKMNEYLPGTETYDMPDMAMIESSQPLMRGGGDLLKGLNVSKAMDMVIGKYYALIIGIDKYKGAWAPLVNAVNDAGAVEQLLKSKYKFDIFNTLYNEKATRTGIIQQMEWLVSNVKEDDNVFIYYSGHGEYNQALGKGYWVPADATSNTSTSNYISNSDLQTFLGGIKSKHTLLVSDACFSGDIFRGNTVSVPFEESQKYYNEVSNLASRQAITSGGIEPVMDGGKEGHSVFAYYFLRTLRTNQNKYFDAGQLYTKIKIPVINNSEQTPKLSPIKKTGDEGGQFIFITK